MEFLGTKHNFYASLQNVNKLFAIMVVRINDRGPFIKGRVLDLSKGAAQKLGFIGAGHTKVCYSKI